MIRLTLFIGLVLILSFSVYAIEAYDDSYYCTEDEILIVKDSNPFSNGRWMCENFDNRVLDVPGLPQINYSQINMTNCNASGACALGDVAYIDYNNLGDMKAYEYYATATGAGECGAIVFTDNCASGKFLYDDELAVVDTNSWRISIANDLHIGYGSVTSDSGEISLNDNNLVTTGEITAQKVNADIVETDNLTVIKNATIAGSVQITPNTIQNVIGDLYLGASGSDIRLLTGVSLRLLDDLTQNADNKMICTGVVNDLCLTHDGTNNYINGMTGKLIINNTAAGDIVLCNNSGTNCHGLGDLVSSNGNHNDLTGLQGGKTGEYYHWTAANYSDYGARHSLWDIAYNTYLSGIGLGYLYLVGGQTLYFNDTKMDNRIQEYISDNVTKLENDPSSIHNDSLNFTFFSFQNSKLQFFQNATNHINIIYNDTTLYVSPTGNDDTGDGSISSPYATPAKALTSLEYSRFPMAIITIQILEGNYTLTDYINSYHPDAANILIYGTGIKTKSILNISTTAGSSGAWNITLSTNNVTNAAVGDYVIVYGAVNGTNPSYIMGAHRIINVDETRKRISLISTHQASTAPSGKTKATMLIFKTKLYFPSGHGASSALATLIKIRDLAMIGTSSYKGVITSGGATVDLENVALSNWQYGLYATAGGVITAGPYVAATNSSVDGALGSLGTFNVPYFTANGNGRHGVLCQSGCVYTGNLATITGNTNNGFYMLYGASGACANSVITGNKQSGARLTGNSDISMTNALISENAQYGVRMDVMSYGRVTNAVLGNNTSGDTSIAVNTLSSSGSYIEQ